MKLKLLRQPKLLISNLTAIVLVFSLILYTAPPVHAAPTTEWTAYSAAEANRWQSVTWSPELSLFVAVAESGTNRVMTSPDGITWTARAAAEANSWQSVTWSPELDLFVAVAADGTNQVMTSPDGINWTARAAAEANGWLSVTWSPELNLFVAVAWTGPNQVMTSPDGITWTAQATPGTVDNWRSVTWSAERGLFVAVASLAANYVMTSPDGENWTYRTAAVNTLWTSVTWSPELGLFVAVAQDFGSNEQVMTSPDGITWTARTAAEPSRWESVIWSPEAGLFVAVAQFNFPNLIMTSPDGINWTGQAAPENSQWQSVIWSPELERFVAVAQFGTNRVMTSEVLDNDGKSNVIEDAAPKSGDANNDGRRDRYQSHVTSFVNPVTNKYATLEVDEACQNNSVSVVSESANAVSDPGYNYPAGLMNFTTDCGTPGFTASVTQYYYGVSKEGLVLRKYNPNTGAYFTVTGATLEDVTIGGQAAVKATYQVTDGGNLDTDGTANGVIVDPVGLAEQVVGVPNTGLGGVRW